MATLRREPRPTFDVRGVLAAELRDNYVVELSKKMGFHCPFEGRAAIIEAAEVFEIRQWEIPRELWISRNPSQRVACTHDGKVSALDEICDELPPMPIYQKPTR